MLEQGMNLKWLHYFQLESKLIVKDKSSFSFLFQTFSSLSFLLLVASIEA